MSNKEFPVFGTVNEIKERLGTSPVLSSILFHALDQGYVTDEELASFFKHPKVAILVNQITVGGSAYVE